MNRILLGIAVLIVIFGLLGTGCGTWGYVAGTGPVVEKTFYYKNFSNVEISSAIEYEIYQASDYSVKVSTHENLMDLLDIHQSGKTLIIRLKPGYYIHSDIRVTVNLPDINKLEVSGASQGSLKGFKSDKDFELVVSGASRCDIDLESGDTEIEVSGASKISGNIKASDMHFTASGASRCDFEGVAQNADITISGASHLEWGSFRLKNVNIIVSGASKANIFTDGELSLDISGASTLSYAGKPTLNKINVTGASKINAN
jgi:hypothetical protein